jgi:hypothetical protein
MQLFKSGNHVRKWRDFYAPTVRSWRPEFGPEGKHFVSGNSLFFSFWGAAKLLLARGAHTVKNGIFKKILILQIKTLGLSN